MKTKLIAIALLMFIGTGAFAQGFKLGLKGGANIGKVNGEAFKDKFTWGYQIGGFATVAIGDKFAIQPEVMFNQLDLDTSSHFSDVYTEFNKRNNIKFNSLTIPVMFNYNLNKIFTLQAGPQFGIVLNQDKNLLRNGEDAFKSGNFALAGGLQLNLLKFRVYGRYVGGLTNLDNVGNKDSWKVQSMQVGIGFTL